MKKFKRFRKGQLNWYHRAHVLHTRKGLEFYVFLHLNIGFTEETWLKRIKFCMVFMTLLPCFSHVMILL